MGGRTERCRTVKGIRGSIREYIPELRTERSRRQTGRLSVDCGVAADVTPAGVDRPSGCPLAEADAVRRLRI